MIRWGEINIQIIQQISSYAYIIIFIMLLT